MTNISHDLLWWITVIDIPALAGLLFMIIRLRAEHYKVIETLNAKLDKRCDQLREALHAFKLEAAKTYVSQQNLSAKEKGLIAHLIRVEEKLDATVIATERLKVTIETSNQKEPKS